MILTNLALLETYLVAGLRRPADESTFEIDPDKVTSGPAGFFVIALLVLAVIGLCFPMVRTLRRMGYRAQVQQEIAAELEAQKQASASANKQDQ